MATRTNTGKYLVASNQANPLGNAQIQIMTLW